MNYLPKNMNIVCIQSKNWLRMFPHMKHLDLTSKQDLVSTHLDTVYSVLTAVYTVVNDDPGDVIFILKINFPPMSTIASRVCTGFTDELKKCGNRKIRLESKTR